MRVPGFDKCLNDVGAGHRTVSFASMSGSART